MGECRSRQAWFRGVTVVLAGFVVFVAACAPAPSTPGTVPSEPNSLPTLPGDPVNPNTTTSIVPTPVSTTIPAPPALPLGRVRSLAAGYDHTCAVVQPDPDRVANYVVCWGRNTFGQLGNGTTGGTARTPVTVQGLVNVTSIAAGGDHTCAVREPAGSVRGPSLLCWGSNSRGQLGVPQAGRPGGIASSNTPVVVPGLSFPFSVTAGAEHTCATESLGSGGQVKCWGNGDSGQTGILLRRPAGVLLGVQSLNVVAGGDHTCALTPPGTLFGNAVSATAKCWGSNLESQLGSGPASTGGPRARNVFAPRDLRELSTKSNHTCGRRRYGLESSILCWGSNFAGQLGFDGPNPAIPVPVDLSPFIPTDRAFWVVAAGGGHTCVTDADRAEGRIVCWGLNRNGQLGNGSAADSSARVLVSGVTNARSVEAGLNHTCAVLDTGQVQCWGQNTFGQLGDGGTADQSTPGNVLAPAPPPPPPPAAPGSETISAGSQHTCAVVAGGRVRCWGFNSSGQLGTGDRGERQVPADVRDLADAVQVSAGSIHTCAVRRGGQVSCWGRNASGQLGDGTRVDRNTPVTVVGLTDAVQVSAGLNHSCAVLRGGTVRCWGSNFGGFVLGSGLDIDSSTTPVDVRELDGVIQVAAGNDYTCVLRSDTTVQCWGDDGQVGNGAVRDEPLPAPVVNIGGEPLSGVTRITAGQFHACALITGGGASCWGSVGSGALGTGDTRGSDVAVPVSGLSDATWIDAGNGYTCAIVSGGGRCWGSNTYGQLGSGTFDGPDVLTPAPISSLPPGTTQITAGRDHTCSRTGAGAASCWGSDLLGQLGNGTGTGRGSQSSPFRVVGF